MRITVQLTSSATKDARAAVDSTASRSVLPWLDYQLRPVHPDTDDPDLSSYFTVDVSERDEAEDLARELMEDPAVQAAYIKPDDEPA